ncbi:YfhO family protein [Phototrophicus methaneseepsis]|uniref:YfhO family protein n=1 Tax=Phototrophicus methaneseepsis TaxID=2710758 RepID=A0A7S8E5R4_9CHLR|nr:YfhO family protein [Phototrophicus methaneseepsis]QPC80876.1 YfhO family protein [Phototrophicus methaneseepsis]
MFRRYRGDLFALLGLVLLWVLFFWRILTPIAADQASFTKGDFSGQFVAFGAYQYQRMSEGEIPLWNPYNNGGLPFIADTQAAVFYPPRLITIFFSKLAGAWSYNALQLEAAFHVLLLSALMYLYLRLLTIRNISSRYGAFAGAVIMAYGGFTTGYPPLQLALLEAAIWLPLGATGILLATQQGHQWRWLALTGAALGLSWLAGHPQTSWFMTYVFVAYYGYRIYQQRLSWRTFLLGTIFLGIVTVGATAVTLLPGAQYLALATRSEFGFNAKRNGFPLQDVIQFILPGSVSLWSPLYVGIPALILTAYAIRTRLQDSRFWAIIGLLALLFSFGGNSVLYHAAYYILPGLRFFRGQERAAFLVASSLAILAGTGLSVWPNELNGKWLRRAAWAFAAVIGLLGMFIIVAWLGNRDAYASYISISVLSTVIACVNAAAISYLPQSRFPRYILPAAIVGIIIFELFTVNIDSEANYDSIPAMQQLDMNTHDLLAPVIADTSGPFRVDGFRGLQANYGSLYNIMDIRGISPLFLGSAYDLIYANYINNPLAWELFAVKYVYSERDQLHVPTTIIQEGQDSEGTVYLHQLNDPRPFAMLFYHADVVDSDAFALALLDDPDYEPRESVILLGEPTQPLPQEAPDTGTVTVTSYEPERLRLEASTPENALLSLAQVDYPGWQATLDGQPISIRRAYGTLMALEVPAGQHTIEIVYNPSIYHIGAILSLGTWLALAILAGLSLMHVIVKGRHERH